MFFLFVCFFDFIVLVDLLILVKSKPKYEHPNFFQIIQTLKDFKERKKKKVFRVKRNFSALYQSFFFFPILCSPNTVYILLYGILG